jgi:hypothetical protein
LNIKPYGTPPVSPDEDIEAKDHWGKEINTPELRFQKKVSNEDPWETPIERAVAIKNNVNTRRVKSVLSTIKSPPPSKSEIPRFTTSDWKPRGEIKKIVLPDEWNNTYTKKDADNYDLKQRTKGRQTYNEIRQKINKETKANINNHEQSVMNGKIQKNMQSYADYAEQRKFIPGKPKPLLGANFTTIKKDGTPGKTLFPSLYKVKSKKSLKEFVMETINSPDPNKVRADLRNRNAKINNPLFRAKNAVSGGVNAVSGGVNAVRNAVSPTRNIIPNKATVGTGNIIAGREYTNKKTDWRSGNDPYYYNQDKVNARINTAYAPNSYNQTWNNSNLLNGDNLQRQTNQSNLKKEQDKAKAARMAQRSEYYQNTLKPAITRTASNIARKAMSRNYWRKDIKPALNTIADAFRR